MLTAVFSLGSALGYTIHDVLMMRVVRSTPVFTALFWVQSVALVLFVPVWLVFIGLPVGAEEWRAAGLAALSGPIEVLALAALLKALAVGKLSIVGPLAALGGGFGAVFAIALGESVTGLAVVGLPLAVAGTVLASIERGKVDEAGRRSGASAAAGAGWALLCAAIFGVEPVLLGEAAAISPLAVVSIGRLASLGLLVPLLLVAYGFRMKREYAVPVGIAGAVDALAFLALAAATAIGPVATAAVLVAQVGTLSAVVGMWALRERPGKVQTAGIVTAVLAVTLLALGNGG